MLNSLDYFLRVDTCIDGGSVWDYDEHRCRDDCLTFVKGKGCIYMHQAYREVFEGCPYSPEECEKRMDKELFIMCEKYQGAWYLKDVLIHLKNAKKEWIKNYLSCVKNTKELGIWTIRPATFILA